MHLLAATATPRDDQVAVDLAQTPGEIVALSAADSDLACLAAARRRLGDGFPSVRLANLMRLGHPVSVDLHADAVLRHAKVILVRLLGGVSYWRYGVERIVELARRRGIEAVFLPGDSKPDPELARLSTVGGEADELLHRHFAEGGIDNAEQALKRLAGLIGYAVEADEPAALPRVGIHGHWPAVEGQPTVPLIFYRALVQAGDAAPVDALASALAERGANPLPIFVSSLKEPETADFLDAVFARARPDVIINFTGFAVGSIGGAAMETALTRADCPVLQAVLSSGDREEWATGSRGLGPRDIAMNVALPEIDGRVLAGVVSFKRQAERDPLTEVELASHAPEPSRIAHVADLALGWARLRRASASERKIGLILANYPTRDGRIGNGVGLDTPAATVEILRGLKSVGYALDELPADGQTLMARLTAGPTNALKDRSARTSLPPGGGGSGWGGFQSDPSLASPPPQPSPIEGEGVFFAVAAYRAAFAALHPAVQAQITERWGDPAADPHVVETVDGPAFALSGFRLGHVAVLIQPARGYHIDPAKSYHDPDLVPPHFYLASYLWLRREFGVHAIVHIGKHGTLEWLPGKALALDETCLPEAALGPVPHLYPFIVNDPGEGTQGKRRSGAVVIDHLTPPLTRAESYGPMRELERLVDEYYEASALDPRRLKPLARDILDLAQASGIAADCGIEADAGLDPALKRLDAFLCDLKELQIRDGLHVFGISPEGRLLTDLLVALTRTPRGRGEGQDASLLRALSDDLGLGFDPLACDFAEEWSGPRPTILSGDEPWRTAGDTVERLELLAARLVEMATAPPTPTLPLKGGGSLAPSLHPPPLRGREGWGGRLDATDVVLDWIATDLRPTVAACGSSEIAGLLTGLDGRFVPPGPSGAPTRGRPDVLPTGRNFYSVDTRAVPTHAAWSLGWKSAQLLVERYAQEHGSYPKRMALSSWGTSTMRTGGDDVAQCLALMGVRPVWDDASHRVTGFEILPAGLLDRPRVDVTLRVSGFFRDAFPGLIDLVDRAARAVAALNEPADINPLAAHVAQATRDLVAYGLEPAEAKRRASFRVFGAKPGAYGAGLQALIDERGWETKSDLADAFLAWGGYAYGSDGEGGTAEGAVARDRLTDLLGKVEAVVHNQDNREHDLLDSDDYYQFEGGLAVTVEALSGQRPAVYHNDHSRPDNPRIRRLEEELARVVRGRAANPKWLAGVRRHGYKGAAEIAATVDYLFAFAATTGLVANHHFDALYQAYLVEPVTREFIAAANPAALAEIAERFDEAIRRGLWQPRSNIAGQDLSALALGEMP
jgi:cobaltochelatase CobN